MQFSQTKKTLPEKLNRFQNGDGNFENSKLFEGLVTRQPQSYLSSVLFHLVSSLLCSCLSSCLLSSLVLPSLVFSVSVCLSPCVVVCCSVLLWCVCCGLQTEVFLGGVIQDHSDHLTIVRRLEVVRKSAMDSMPFPIIQCTTSLSKLASVRKRCRKFER